jgi:hypothetical protein
MVALIEVVLGLFLAGLVLLELTGKTDFLGRKKREEVIERAERRAEERDEESDDRPF